MNSWSRTRKRMILFILLLALVVLVGVPLYYLFYNEPSCNDGKLNRDEAGIDCGGSCQRLCSAESLPLIVRGDPRILSIALNVYEVDILLENPNASAEIYRAYYTIRLYALDTVEPIKIITGSTFIPKGAKLALFEGPFTILDQVPNRAVVEWQQESLAWQKSERTMPELTVKDIVLSKVESAPRLEAVVENLTLESATNIDLVALITNEEGSVFAASKTYVDALSPGEEAPIIFTWPRPFTSAVYNVEIITRIFPDSTFSR